jgi:hydrogenase maturation protease
MARTLLLIGVGNPLRGDDGAGPLLAERLASLLPQAGFTVRTLLVHQLVPELALEIAQDGVDALIFIDASAMQDDNAPMLTRVLEGTAPANATHTLTPDTVLTYAARLYDRRPPAWLLTIPGCDFGFGDKLSPAVARLMESPAPIVERLVCALAGCHPDVTGLPDAQGPAH